MTDEQPNAKDRVKRRHPCAGAELSAMHGWRIADYEYSQHNPTYLNRGTKTEAAAWRSVANRRGYRT